MLQKLNKILDIPLCLIRKWWRPVTCVGIAGSVLVHGIILPLMNNTPAELMSLSALITAATAAFAVREWGKVKGTVE